MKFIWIFGPPAVGKMTIGQELEKITELKLFHNHMIMDVVDVIFGKTAESGRLSQLFIDEILESASKSEMYGLIFTSVQNFENKRSLDFATKTCDMFRSRGADIYFVELETEINVRIERNKSPHRLAHKPSKRNYKETERGLLDGDTERRNSFDGEIKERNYIRINNTKIEPDKVAKTIKDTFAL